MKSQTDKDNNITDAVQESTPLVGSSDNSTHSVSLAALCCCNLTNAWLVISVFPYSGFMAIELIRSLNEENAGSYAGLLASFFMIGRSVSAYGWGRLADIYGRKFVLLASLGLSSLFSVFFGLSKTFRMAILWRFMLGVSNGIIATSKTTVSEISYGNERLETHGMGLVMGMWSWGFLVSPAISGALAEPVRQYPNSSFVQLFESILARAPFLLPNLVSALLCCITMALVWIYLPETLPKEILRSPKYLPQDTRHWFVKILQQIASIIFCSKNPKQKERRDIPSSIEKSTNTSDQDNCKHHDGQISGRESPTAPVTLSQIWSRQSTRRHLITYWCYSMIAIGFEEAFPLFCISRQAGLGLSEGSIGNILSGSGLLFALSQYVVYTWIVDRCGLQKSMVIGAGISGFFIAFVPVSLWINQGIPKGQVGWPCYMFLSILLATLRVFSLVFFASIAIATNRTVVPAYRGTLNGLSMLGGSFAKGFGPTFAGCLVAFSFSSGVFTPGMGAAFLFSVLGSLGTLVAPMATCLNQDEEDIAEAKPEDNV